MHLSKQGHDFPFSLFAFRFSIFFAFRFSIFDFRISKIQIR